MRLRLPCLHFRLFPGLVREREGVLNILVQTRYQTTVWHTMRRVIPDQGSVVELQTQAMPDCRAGDDGAVDEQDRERLKNAEHPAWADAPGV